VQSGNAGLSENEKENLKKEIAETQGSIARILKLAEFSNGEPIFESSLVAAMKNLSEIEGDFYELSPVQIAESRDVSIVSPKAREIFDGKRFQFNKN